MVSKCWSDTPTISGSTALLLQQTVYAFAFVPNQTQYLHAMRWYRSQTGGSQHPDALMLWDTTTQTTVAYTGSPTDDGSVGWQQTNVGSTIELVSGREYRVGIYLLGGSVRTANFTTTNPTDAADDLDHASTKYRYIQNTYGYPSLTASSYYCAVDVVTDDTPPDPDSGIDVGDVRNLFTSWLSSTGDNTHQDDGLPWLTKVVVDAIKTTTDALATSVAGVVSDVGDVLTDTGTILTRTAGLVGGSIQSALTASQTAVTDAIDAATAATQAGIDAGTALLALFSNGPGGMAPATDAGWQLVESGSFNGSFEVAERCDRVYVAFSDVETTGPHYAELGHLLWNSAWWWEPVFNGYAGTYQTQRNTEATLYVPGMRMDGVRCHISAERSGTWEAWRFDG